MDTARQAFLLRCVLALALLAGTSRADYEETEHRLKIAGVDPALRERIHGAIDRGVAWLAARQRPDGSWNTATAVGSAFEVNIDHTVLAACALRHAGTPDAKRAFRRALEWLVPAGSEGRARYRDYVYTAGFMQMALAADGSHPELARAIRDDVRASLGRQSGYWGYWLRHGGARQSVHKENDVANLSTTQFGALALWAGDRVAGAEGSEVAWRRHLEALIIHQLRDGSWAYAPTRTPPTGYPNGTFMGLANLVLARSALQDALLREPALLEAADRALSAGIEAFHRDAAGMLEAVEGRGPRSWSYGGWSYYGLYALEKAATFLGWNEVGGRRWYETGARILLDLQEDDGHWGSTSAEGWQAMGNNPHVSTVFALLFLLRASEVYRPVTPRRPDAARGPVSGGTGGDPAPPTGSGGAPPVAPPYPAPAPPGATPPPAGDGPTPGGEAASPEESPASPSDPPEEDWRTLERQAEALERALRDRDREALELDASLRGLARDERERGAAAAEAPPGPSGDARPRAQARLAVDRALLAALVLHPPTAPTGDPRARLRATAAGLLKRRATPDATVLRRTIARALVDPDDVALPADGWHMVLGVLAARAEPDAFEWIAEDLVTADSREARIERTLGALRAMREFPPMPGRSRREAFERTLRRFVPVERATPPPGDREEARRQGLQELWDVLRPDVLETLRHLATDPSSGTRPTVEAVAGSRGATGRRPAGTLRALERWWHDHDDPGRAPWRDP